MNVRLAVRYGDHGHVAKFAAQQFAKRPARPDGALMFQGHQDSSSVADSQPQASRHISLSTLRASACCSVHPSSCCNWKIIAAESIADAGRQRRTAVWRSTEHSTKSPG